MELNALVHYIYSNLKGNLVSAKLLLYTHLCWITYAIAELNCYYYRAELLFRAEPIHFCTYFSFQQFFFSYLFCLIFCSLSIYFSTHKRFFLVYLQLLSIHDCCIRAIHNMQVTALLVYLDLLAVFPEA